MHEPTDRPTRPFRRAALRVGLLVGVAGVFLLLNPLAARADDGDSSGLVGEVAGAVDQVTETVAGTVDEVGQTVDEGIETVEGVVEETAPVVEDVLDTGVGAVEDVVETPVFETVEDAVDDVTGAADPGIGAPDVGAVPPPDDGEGPRPVRSPHERVTGHRAALELRVTVLDATTPSVGTATPAGESPAATARVDTRLAPGADPVDAARPPADPASGGADQPFNPRIPGGQDLAVLAAALLVALALVRTSRREGGTPTSPAFLSILERPG